MYCPAKLSPVIYACGHPFNALGSSNECSGTYIYVLVLREDLVEIPEELYEVGGRLE